MTTDLYFEKHKSIRNKIRTFVPGKLLGLAMRILFQNELNFPNGGYLPWELMLLIRWTLQYQNWSAKKEPTVDSMNRLLNQIKNLYALDRLLPEGGPHALSKFMRRTAFQQLSYQLKDHHLTQKVGRQLILFEDIGKDFNIPVEFEAHAGVKPEAFLKYCFCLFGCIVINNQQFVSMADFRLIPDSQKIQKIFDLSSLTVEQARDYLQEDALDKKGRFALQLYEVSPLARFPFLKLGNRYACYSKSVFYYFYSNYIDDFLSKKMKDWGRVFGEILEKYVAQRLQDTKTFYIPDSAWKKRLSAQIPVPDFTIPNNDGTVFIEVKSKILGLQPRVFQTNAALVRNLDDSVVKGVVQIYSLAHALQQQAQSDIKNTNRLYGIVISYKEHYLRGGGDIWNEFLKDEVERELQSLGIDSEIIPPANLFLLSIDEFDYLAMFMQKYPAMPLVAILEKAKELSASPETTSFFFEDYLRKMSPDNSLQIPEWLRQRTLALPDEVLKMMEGR